MNHTYINVFIYPKHSEKKKTIDVYVFSFSFCLISDAKRRHLDRIDKKK